MACIPRASASGAGRSAPCVGAARAPLLHPARVAPPQHPARTPAAAQPLAPWRPPAPLPRRRRAAVAPRAQPEEAAAAAAAAATDEEPAPLLRATVPCGQLFIRPLQERDARGAALLLTRAFAGTPEAVALDEATDFMAAQLRSPQLGVTLVARLVPTDPSLLPPGQGSRLVGTVALAFDLRDAASRDGLGRLAELPAAACYLSNMAVDPKLRRNGVARAMLAACDAAAASAAAAAPPPRSEVWLHVREADGPARQLYEGAGFEAVEKEAGGGGGGFLGFGGGAPRRARILMRRRVQGS